VQTSRNAFYYARFALPDAYPAVIKRMLLYALAFGLPHPRMLTRVGKENST